MEKDILCKQIAKHAVNALIREAMLTPKPGLVDQQDTGSHEDMTLEMMIESARLLYETFYEMAWICYGEAPTIAIREKFGAIGRAGEEKMFAVTNGVNTHKGAIWSLGLLSSACSMLKGYATAKTLCEKAADLANIEDQFVPKIETNGSRAVKTYGLRGAKQEAQEGFPHVLNVSLPVYEKERIHGEKNASIMSLLSLIATLDDTCIVHRGGIEGLMFAQRYAKKILDNRNLQEVTRMNKAFIARRLSPGGSADLLGATFLIADLIKMSNDKLVKGCIAWKN